MTGVWWRRVVEWGADAADDRSAWIITFSMTAVGEKPPVCRFGICMSKHYDND